MTPKIGAEKTFGNTFAYFDFKDAQGAQIIRHKFKVQVWELQWNLDPDKIVAVADWPNTFERYRRGETQAIVVDKRFDELLGRIVPNRGNPLLEMSAVMDWMIQDFKYDHVDASLQAKRAARLGKASWPLQRLPRVLRGHGAGAGLSNARDVRHQPDAEELTLPLQA